MQVSSDYTNYFWRDAVDVSVEVRAFGVVRI